VQSCLLTTLYYHIQASFTISELRELLHLDTGSSSCVIPGDKVAELQEAMEKATRPRKRILDLMLKRRVPRSPGYERVMP